MVTQRACIYANTQLEIFGGLTIIMLGFPYGFVWFSVVMWRLYSTTLLYERRMKINNLKFA